MNRIVSVLQWGAGVFETRGGRIGFWAAVGVVLVVFGGIVVKRAEFPKRQYVAELHYDSPMVIGEAADKQAKYHSSEFRSFRRQAWGTVVEGLDPYDSTVFHLRAYPPFFNVFFMPFAGPWKLRGVGSALFYLASFGLALLSAWWLSGWAGREGEGRFGLFALVFVLLAPAALNVMARCETDMFVLGAVSGALYLLGRGRRPFRAGCLLGFAAAFKVLPGLFGVYLICRRKWRALGGMVVGGVLCTVVLPVFVFGPRRAAALHASWYAKVVAPYGSGGAGAVIGQPARSSNQSLAAALNRTLRPVPVVVRGVERRLYVNVASLAPATVRRITRGIQVFVGLGLAAVWLYCTRRGEGPAAAATLFGLVAPGILILSDVSLTTHHVLLIVPMSVVMVRALAFGDARARRWLWVVPLHVVVLLALAVGRVKMLTPLLPLTFALLAAGVVLALQDRAAGRDQGDSA